MDKAKFKHRKLILKIWIPVLGLLLCAVFMAACPNAFAQAQQSKEEESLFVAKKALEDGFYDVSLGLLERFFKNYPDSSAVAEANLLVGLCYYHQNKFLNALEQFNGLLNKPQAKNIQDAVLYWIAEVHFRGNNFSKAGEFYKKVIDTFPESSYGAASYYSLGWSLFQEQSFKQALDYFEAVENKFADGPYAQDAGFKIIECLYNLKDYAALKERLKSRFKIYSKDAAKVAYLYFYMAEADYYLNNLNEALEEYAQALSSAADDQVISLSRLGMGWCYLKLKQYVEAENNFQKVNSPNLGKAGKNILLLGRGALKQEIKSFAEAKVIYKELLDGASDPGMLMQAYIGQAEALYNLGEYKEAINVYRQALTKVSNDTPGDSTDKLHYGLAWVFLKEGEFKNAIDEFRRIVKSSGDNIVKVSALCQIGDAYQDSGEYKKAIEVYDSVLKDYPDSSYGDYVQYQLGLALIKASNYEAAIMAFKTLKLNFPASKLLDDATYALGLAYFQREDYNSSREIFHKFQEDFKDSPIRPQAMYLMGTSLYNLNKFSEAVDVFKNIVKAYNHDAVLVQKCEYEIADCFDRMGNESEAIARFKSLRAKYPDSQLTPEVMWWLGEYYYRHSMLEQARRYFSSLIRDFSKSNLVPDAYYAMGASFVEEAKFDEAITNFKKVIEFGKSDLAASAVIAISDIYLKEEKFDMALEAYNSVLPDYQNLAHLIYPKIAEIYSQQGNYAKAAEFFGLSLNLVPARQMGDIQFKIAQAKQAQGLTLEAIEEYLKVSYLYSENNEMTIKALLRVGAIYEDKEDFKEALKIYQRVVSMKAEESKYAAERIDWIKEHVKLN